ncbi:hypothetical protein GCM10023069_71820 [Shinella granuli]
MEIGIGRNGLSDLQSQDRQDSNGKPATGVMPRDDDIARHRRLFYGDRLDTDPHVIDFGSHQILTSGLTIAFSTITEPTPQVSSSAL